MRVSHSKHWLFADLLVGNIHLWCAIHVASTVEPPNQWKVGLAAGPGKCDRLLPEVRVDVIEVVFSLLLGHRELRPASRKGHAAKPTELDTTSASHAVAAHAIHCNGMAARAGFCIQVQVELWDGRRDTGWGVERSVCLQWLQADCTNCVATPAGKGHIFQSEEII